MHTGQRSYSIYNDKVYSLIFYSDKFLSFQKHFHIHDNENHIKAFKNSSQIRVFLSQKCETNIDFKKTIRNNQLFFNDEIKLCPYNYFFVGCFYPWQICCSNNIKYPFFIVLNCKPRSKYLENI